MKQYTKCLIKETCKVAGKSILKTLIGASKVALVICGFGVGYYALCFLPAAYVLHWMIVTQSEAGRALIDLLALIAGILLALLYFGIFVTIGDWIREADDRCKDRMRREAYEKKNADVEVKT